MRRVLPGDPCGQHLCQGKMAARISQLLGRSPGLWPWQYRGFILFSEVIMGILSRSPWLIHYDGSSCNGCDIEVLACLTPVYDVERFGVINTGNPKHADILLITGSMNVRNAEVVKNLYNQMPSPKVVVAVGICATSGCVFAEAYN